MDANWGGGNDVTFYGPAAGPEPAYYLPLAQQPWFSQFVAVRTVLEPTQLVGPLREAVWSIDRDLPLQRIRTMDQMMANASARAVPDIRLEFFWCGRPSARGRRSVWRNVARGHSAGTRSASAVLSAHGRET